MATNSQSSRHKSRLLREMSRDLNRSINSVASSTGSNHGTVSTDSTMTEFDPEKDEAIMSTRQLDNNYSQKLPELRNTAKKYGRWAPREQTDVVINTSAIGRAFPGFSDGGSSDDSMMSIEVGRGAKSNQRTSPSRIPRAEYSDNFDSSPVVTIGSVKILGTPQKSQTKANFLQDALRNSASKKEITSRRDTGSHKENIPPLNSQKPAKVSPYVSHASRTTSGERRTLAELHAKVADDTDGSLIGDGRPTTVTFQPKNTRFSSTKSNASHVANVSSKRQEVEELVEKFRTTSGTPSKSQKPQGNYTTNPNTPNPTQQSFLLPAMPELSIISNSYNKGVPISTQGGRVFSRSHNAIYLPHNVVDGIPLPGEEQDIYLDIDLLRAKVAELELERAEAVAQLAESFNQNEQLENEIRLLKRQSFTPTERSKIQKERDQAVVQLAQSLNQTEELENELRQLKGPSEAERSKTRIERDQAVTQLAESLDENERFKIENRELRLRIEELCSEREQLKFEIEDLKHEVDALRKLLSEMTTENENTTRSLEGRDGKLRKENKLLQQQLEEIARRHQAKESDLQDRIQRNEKAISKLQDMTNEISHTTREIKVTSSRKQSKALERDLAAKVTHQAQEQLQQLKSANVNRDRRSTGQISEVRPIEIATLQRSRSVSQQRSEKPKKRAHSAHQRSKSTENNLIRDDANQDASFEGNTTLSTIIHKDAENSINGEGNTVDSDGSEYASILGPNFMKNLRQQVKEVRTAKRELNAVSTHDGTIQTVQSVQSSCAPSVKGPTGILKNGGSQNQEDLTGRFSIKSAVQATNDRTIQSNASHCRHRSETSVHNTRRRRNETDDMTSAFIIPDISFNSIATGEVHPSLSASARRVLDGLCKHDCTNCTVCTRVASFDTKKISKQTVVIPKPIPVSDRMPESKPYEDEPTLRPSVEPGLALGTVIKGLEDEVAHLKMEQTRITAAYAKHDSSLGMRQRKALKKRLDELLIVIEKKSDQIYALYDVLEGQKQTGQEMSEKDVEVTLLSIGIGAEEDDSELDLPWEGIEDTIDRV